MPSAVRIQPEAIIVSEPGSGTDAAEIAATSWYQYDGNWSGNLSRRGASNVILWDLQGYVAARGDFATTAWVSRLAESGAGTFSSLALSNGLNLISHWCFRPNLSRKGQSRTASKAQASPIDRGRPLIRAAAGARVERAHTAPSAK
jgi:hypothetical protein